MSSFFNKHPLELLDIHAMHRQADFNSDQTGGVRFKASLYDKTAVLISKPSGTAGDDLALKLVQADAATSGNTKAINFDEVFYKLNNADQWTRLGLTTATNDLDTGATGESTSDLAGDTVAAEFLIWIRNDLLDGANGYEWISYENEGDDVSNALLVNVFAVGIGPRYSKAIPLDPV